MLKIPPTSAMRRLMPLVLTFVQPFRSRWSSVPESMPEIPTAVKLAPENPIWFRVNSRSGLAIKHGIITIAGIIDTDYRGELIIGLLNTNPAGEKAYIINPGDKIAQVEVPFPYKAVFEEVSNEEFESYATCRGESGFGSTGR